MVTKTEGKHAGEFLLSEANGDLSREVATLAGGNVVEDGDVLELVGAKIAKHQGALNTDGDVVVAAVGIVIGNWDASAGDVKGVPYIAREAEVRDSSVGYGAGDGVKDAQVASLAALNIIPR